MKKRNLAILLVVIGALSALAFVGYGYGARVRQEQTPISLEEFNKRVNAPGKTVLVYFSADWCRVCLKMKPVVEETEKTFGSRLDILRIDTERDKEVRDAFEVDTLPVLVLYKNGHKEWIYVGLIDADLLKAKISPYL